MAIINVHPPLAFTFGILGNLISISVYLAPAPTFYRIWRKKSTEGFQSLPYLVALFSSMLWLYYAMLKKNAFLLITINSFGCVIETIYIIIYLAYAEKEIRVSTIKLLVSMNMALFSFILLLTHYLVGDSVEVEVLGWINVGVSVCVFAAPLSIIAQVIKTKSVEFMPFTLSFCLTLSAVMWFCYGLSTKDKCVALPNLIGFCLGMVQMIVYAIFRNSSLELSIEEKKLPAEELKSIVILTTPLDACEVIPVDMKPKSEELVMEDPKQSYDHKMEKIIDVNLENPKPILCAA